MPPRGAARTDIPAPAPEAPEARSLFDRVADAIGATSAYIAREVMPDIRVHLVEEAWFGRSLERHGPVGPGQQQGFTETWRGGFSTSLDIETNPDRSDGAASHSHDLER